jgi:hypothetical protein
MEFKSITKIRQIKVKTLEGKLSKAREVKAGMARLVWWQGGSRLENKGREQGISLKGMGISC